MTTETKKQIDKKIDAIRKSFTSEVVHDDSGCAAKCFAAAELYLLDRESLEVLKVAANLCAEIAGDIMRNDYITLGYKRKVLMLAIAFAGIAFFSKLNRTEEALLTYINESIMYNGLMIEGE